MFPIGNLFDISGIQKINKLFKWNSQLLSTCLTIAILNKHAARFYDLCPRLTLELFCFCFSHSTISIASKRVNISCSISHQNTRNILQFETFSCNRMNRFESKIEIWSGKIGHECANEWKENSKLLRRSRERKNENKKCFVCGMAYGLGLERGNQIFSRSLNDNYFFWYSNHT